jgi:hypothetical protein
MPSVAAAAEHLEPSCRGYNTRLDNNKVAKLCSYFLGSPQDTSALAGRVATASSCRHRCRSCCTGSCMASPLPHKSHKRSHSRLPVGACLQLLRMPQRQASCCSHLASAPYNVITYMCVKAGPVRHNQDRRLYYCVSGGGQTLERHALIHVTGKMPRYLQTHAGTSIADELCILRALDCAIARLGDHLLRTLSPHVAARADKASAPLEQGIKCKSKSKEAV